MRSKSQRHQPYGLLKQLPIPERPWNSISMDFIKKLPTSSGYNTILVIVDRSSKQEIFIPTYGTITSTELAKLVLPKFGLKPIKLSLNRNRTAGFSFGSTFGRTKTRSPVWGSGRAEVLEPPQTRFKQFETVITYKFSNKFSF